MSKILVVVFFGLLYANIAGTLVCLYCPNVKSDNTCDPKETTCHTGPMNYCYTQVFSKGFSIEKVSRGCSPICRTIRFKKYRYEKETLCCSEDRCNDHNIWAKEK